MPEPLTGVRPADAGRTEEDLFGRPRAAEPILDVRDLKVAYGGTVRAVDGVDLTVDPGEFTAVVGESGCGKSTMLFAIAQLLSPPAAITGGSVHFRGANLVTLSKKKISAVRWRDFSVVMQSAMNALNPVMSIGAQFKDAITAHDEHVDDGRPAEVLRLVGVDPIHLKSYPHQLSGGMRQRAMIAMALLFTPDLIIMDEPTSALDVVAQRSLMVQIKDLQRELGFAVLFVTHDMSLVSHFSDSLVVMYAGKVVEIGPTRDVFDHPSHPYSRGLLDAFPSIRGPIVPLTGIPGSPPNLADPPSGCRFHPRCPVAFADCKIIEPDLYDLGPVRSRCLLHRDSSAQQAFPPAGGAR